MKALIGKKGQLYPLIGSDAVYRSDISNLTSSPLFKSWAENISPDISIKNIVVVSVDYTPSGSVIFAKLNVVAQNRRGQELPGIVFLRGKSVAILVVVISKKTGKKYILFVKQLRVAAGGETMEIPAGMLDGQGNFTGKAAQELEEESEVVIDPGDLKSLVPPDYKNGPTLPVVNPGILMSPGACDEKIHFFYLEQEVSETEIARLKRRRTGNKSEREYISLTLVPIARAPYSTNDAKFFTAWALAKLKGLI